MPPTDADVKFADCPFCLAFPSILAFERQDRGVQVLCSLCGAAGPIEADEESAVEGWNEGATRALDDPQQRPAPADLATVREGLDHIRGLADDAESCLSKYGPLSETKCRLLIESLRTAAKLVAQLLPEAAAASPSLAPSSPDR